MPKHLQPKNRKQLFEHLLGLWVKAEKENLKNLSSKAYKREKERSLAEKYREFLALWDSLKW